VRWYRISVIAIAAICSLFLAHQVALAVLPPYRQIVPSWLGGMADKDVTITFEPVIPGFVGPPTTFTATYVTDNVVRLDWAMGLNAENTTIRGKLSEYPNDITDGYGVFDGPGISSNDTSLSFDVLLGTVYYRAWSENSTGNYSATYASAELENPHVVTIAAFTTILSSLWPGVILLLLVLLGIILRAGLILMGSGLGFVIFGLSLWTTLSWLSIILVIVGCVVFWQGAKS
jgi:hypothetical protein